MLLCVRVKGINVTACDWEFDEEAFQHVSDDAKDFIRRLLVKSKEKRLTAHECLMHKWLAGDATASRTATIEARRYEKMRNRLRERYENWSSFALPIGRLSEYSSLRKLLIEKWKIYDGHFDRRQAAPRFVIKPQSAFCYEGQSVKLYCRIIAVATPTVTWSHNNHELRQSVKFMKRYAGDDYYFIINRAKLEDRGEYIIRAENHYGFREEVVFLNVQPVPKVQRQHLPEAPRRREALPYTFWQETSETAPVFTFQLRPRVMQARDTCKLLCCLSGKPTPTVKWYKDRKELSKHDYSMTHSDGVVTMEIIDCRPEDSGKYSCIATNVHGTDETSCVVIVEGSGEGEVVSPEQAQMAHNFLYSGDRKYIEKPIKPAPPPIITKTKVTIDPPAKGPALRPKFSPQSSVDASKKKATGYGAKLDSESASRSRSHTKELVLPASDKTMCKPSFARALPDVLAARDGGALLLSCAVRGDPDPRVEWFKNGKPLHSSEVSVQYQPTAVYRDGGALLLSCAVRGDPDPRVEWFKNGKPLHSSESGEIRPQGRVVQERQATAFLRGKGSVLAYCSITEERCCCPAQSGEIPTPGSSGSRTASHCIPPSQGDPDPRVEWFKNGKPLHSSEVSVQYQPTAVYRDGGALLLSCAVRGDPDPRVEWFKNGKPLHSSEVSVQYQPTAVYRDGGALLLSCAVRGDPDPRVEWFKNGKPLHSSEGDPDPRVEWFKNGKPLHSSEVSVQYQPTAVYRDGGALLLSCAVRGDPDPRVEWFKNGKPLHSSEVSVQYQPTAVYRDGGALLLSCAVRGDPDPRVEWFKNGKPLHSSEVVDLKYKNGVASLAISEVFPEDEGEYSLKAINSQGECQTVCKVTVKPMDAHTAATATKTGDKPPRIVDHAISQTVTDGDAVTLSCRVTGAERFDVVWLHNNKEIKPSKDFQYSSEANIHKLTIAEIFPEDAGVYTCEEVKPSKDFHYSSEANIHKLTIAEIFPEDAGVYTCEVSKRAYNNTYTNVSKARQGDQTVQYSSEENIHKLTIAEIFPEDAGVYTCEVSKRAYNNTYTNVSKARQGDQTVQYSSEENIHKLTIAEIFPEDAGVYTCEVFNDAGESFSSCSLFVNVPGEVTAAPQYTAYPASVTVNAQEPATFFAELDKPPLQLQWLKDGKPIDETSPRYRFTMEGTSRYKLQIASTSGDDAGQYQARAVGSKGDALAAFYLNVVDV
ncbi:immunoglobulin i-set domain-containing protein [Phthorimaea operculella]|nr:immunoglobulin i-set domain-containing protein [Phthorimaea operculella]